MESREGGAHNLEGRDPKERLFEEVLLGEVQERAVQPDENRDLFRGMNC